MPGLLSWHFFDRKFLEFPIAPSVISLQLVAKYDVRYITTNKVSYMCFVQKSVEDTLSYIIMKILKKVNGQLKIKKLALQITSLCYNKIKSESGKNRLNKIVRFICLVCLNYSKCFADFQLINTNLCSL